MQTTERFEKVSIDKLVGYARNARTHSKEQIMQLRGSIREFGFLNPVLVDKDFGIIAGHGRVLAAREEGMTEIPCVFVEHLTEAQKRAYILADNRLALNAGWDEAMLAVELSDLQGAEFDVSLLGFTPDEINKLMGNESPASEDNFDLSKALSETAFVERGDVWTFGKADGRTPHRLMCGDSTNPADILKLMNGNKANLVLTDPPYGIAYESKAGTIQNDSMPDDKFYEFLLAAFTQASTAMANDASIYIFHADTKGEIFRRAFREAGFHLSGCLIWKKSNFTLGRSVYQFAHEPILYGWKVKGKHLWYKGRSESTVWEFDKPKNNDIHPTIKPVPMLAYAIENSTMTGCIVLDLFAGSFSTGIACEQTGRVCYGMELDERYASASIKRFCENYGDADVFVERGGERISYAEVVNQMPISAPNTTPTIPTTATPTTETR